MFSESELKHFFSERWKSVSLNTSGKAGDGKPPTTPGRVETRT